LHCEQIKFIRRNEKLGRDSKVVFAPVIICEAVSNDKLQIDCGFEIAG
jgi:hypothetical protein